MVGGAIHLIPVIHTRLRCRRPSKQWPPQSCSRGTCVNVDVITVIGSGTGVDCCGGAEAIVVPPCSKDSSIATTHHILNLETMTSSCSDDRACEAFCAPVGAFKFKCTSLQISSNPSRVRHELHLVSQWFGYFMEDTSS